jgi:hypothetical protein
LNPAVYLPFPELQKTKRTLMRPLQDILSDIGLILRRERVRNAYRHDWLPFARAAYAE